MYSREDRLKAVKLYILYNLSGAEVMRELGYPKSNDKTVGAKWIYLSGIKNERKCCGDNCGIYFIPACWRAYDRDATIDSCKRKVGKDLV